MSRRCDRPGTARATWRGVIGEATSGRTAGVASSWARWSLAATMLVGAAGVAHAQAKPPGPPPAAVPVSGAAPSAAKAPWSAIGRPATRAEVAAWDIDVRPDWRGMPAGSGSVAKGMDVWDAKCASCHGTFGESNEVFTPIVGGTTKEDMRTGRVKALVDGSHPQRTTMMKLSQLSTLWDYINRAMPWNAPKSLTVEEVYAVTAYILNLADVVPDDFVLSDRNIADVQQKLPNRNGKLFYTDLWNVRGAGDVRNTACMSDCAVEDRIASQLPDHARGSHGNLAEQHRGIGPARGLGPSRPASAQGQPQPQPQPVAAVSKPPLDLARASACTACHAVDGKMVGPSFRDIGRRYAQATGAEALLVDKVRGGGQGSWGPMPMPPQAQVSEADTRALVRWILGGAQ